MVVCGALPYLLKEEGKGGGKTTDHLGIFKEQKDGRAG